MRGEFTIYFDGHLWIGLFSVENAGCIVRVGRYVFGAEPSSAEVYEWLAQGSPGLVMRDVEGGSYETPPFVKTKNPKRLLREVRRSEAEVKGESLAQRCMREQVEQFKKESKGFLKKREKERKQKAFELRSDKRKKKHRGR